MPATWQDYGPGSIHPNAKDLIVVLNSLNLDNMTPEESETLYQLVQRLRIVIEEKWMGWDY